jgi:hypothetical protein
MADIAAEIGVSERTAKRITSDLRQRGWITAARDRAYDATLTWAVVWADTPESANLALSGVPDGHSREGQGGTPKSASLALTPSSKTVETTDKTVRASRQTRLPEQFEVTAEMRDWAAEKVPGVDVDAETETFLDHHGARGSKFVDWRKAWQTWMRNAHKWSRNSSSRRPVSIDDGREWTADDLLRMEKLNG